MVTLKLVFNSNLQHSLTVVEDPDEEAFVEDPDDEDFAESSTIRRFVDGVRIVDCFSYIYATGDELEDTRNALYKYFEKWLRSQNRGDDEKDIQFALSKLPVF